MVVVGIGKSGFAAARYLAQNGANVFATDASSDSAVRQSADGLRRFGVEIQTGGHTRDFFEGATLVIKSPGVSKQNPVLIWAAEQNIPVIGEIELGFRFCSGTIIGITGSNGKTTTCHLLHSMLKHAALRSVLCGNVGRAFLDAHSEINSDTKVVLELSSFQLEDTDLFRPKVSVILNLSANHLDRHGSMPQYVAAKSKIFANQTAEDYLILNYDDDATRVLANHTRARVIFFCKRELKEGIFKKNGCVIFRLDGQEHPMFECSRMLLQGEHNLENAMAAAAAAFLVGSSPEAIRNTVENFKTLEHRLEPVGQIGGVRFVNDSKSTTVASTARAIESIESSMVLVAGGRDKGAFFGEIESLLREKVRRLVLYGESRAPIRRALVNLSDRIEEEEQFDAAVEKAFRLARAGETLLLSPMAASFDQFASFEERGWRFKNIFENLKAEHS